MNRKPSHQAKLVRRQLVEVLRKKIQFMESKSASFSFEVQEVNYLKNAIVCEIMTQIDELSLFDSEIIPHEATRHKREQIEVGESILRKLNFE